MHNDKNPHGISLIVNKSTCKPAEERNFESIECVRYPVISFTTSYFPQNLPSRYARNVNCPINAKSNMSSVQDRKGDQERIRCKTKRLVNTRADCHAWNLLYISTIRTMRCDLLSL
jgi:hypothetical protein